MDAGGYNRYELLDMDDGDSAPAPVVQKPASQPKAPKAAAATTKKPNVQANKENKNNPLNKETANKKAAPKPNAPVAAANKSGSRPNTTGGNAERSGTMQERRNVSFRQDNNEVREQRNNDVREQRNNRRNLRNDEYGNAGQQRPFRENRENRENRGNFRNREGNFRGKREFDRQSGSDKTGVKAVDKRDGAGAHNWGSVKQEIENVDIATADGDTTLTDKEENEVNETAGENVAAPEEETVKEMTLDEYKALRQQREKPKYNIRKPGEGEDTAQWKKMVVLSKKKDADSEEEFEFDPSLYPQRVGRLQRIVDIQFNFKDGRRGGGNFGGRGRGGPRNDNKGRFERGDRNENTGNRNESGKPRNFGDRQQKSGIKIDYESQFPTLG